MPGAQSLLFETGLLTDRYHGVGDWPPSPFRFFQALVAGAYGGRWATEERAEKDAAFEWLERLAPPWVAAPSARVGHSTVYYVPNNDLDAVGGEPRLVAALRVAKVVTPLMLDGAETRRLLYAWQFDGEGRHAETLRRICERLHTLGWGRDPAFARAEILAWGEAEARLHRHPGALLRPSPAFGNPDEDPPCPTAGSFASLVRRHEATRHRFETVGRKTLFRQPPKALSQTVSYRQEPLRVLVDIRDTTGAFRPVPQSRVIELASAAHELIRERLSQAMPTSGDAILRAIGTGRASPAVRSGRIRILPLPTIGHQHANGSVRRLLIEVPPSCPISRADIEWALTGQRLEGLSSGAESTMLVVAEGDRMLQHYGVGARARRFLSVTPIALDVAVTKGALTGGQRAGQAVALARQIVEKVRDAGLPTGGLIVHTQREPFHRNGLRADHFRSASEPWRTVVHAEVIFQEPVIGPIVLGDGELEGLGLFRPCDPRPPPSTSTKNAGRRKNTAAGGAREAGNEALVARFGLHGGPPIGLALPMSEALRAAIMSSQGDQVPVEISGRDDFGPLRSGAHEHAFFLTEDADGDGYIDHVLIYCARGFSRETRRAMNALTRLGVSRHDPRLEMNVHTWAIALEVLARPDELPASNLLGRSRRWRSVTPYMKPRFDQRGPGDEQSRAATYGDQILREWRLRFPAAPIPVVTSLADSPELNADGFVRTRVRRGGHQPDVRGALLELTFPVPVSGPLALGKHAHFGMGLFQRAGLSTEVFRQRRT